MPDRPEDRAARVEKVLESGDLEGAMKKLNDEMSSVTNPDERAAVLKSLKEQNEAANEKHWSLPNVEIKPATEWFGFKTLPGQYEVNMSHNALEKLASGARSANPFDKVAMALDQANKK
jgi:hypothetical protein